MMNINRLSSLASNLQGLNWMAGEHVMENYEPDILEGKYARFLLRVSYCPECGRPMVVRPGRARDPFPYYFKLSFEAQVRAGGFCVRSDAIAGNEYICEDCAQAGRAWFHCELCKCKLPTDKIQEQFGDPPEYLCADCYASVSAKEWDEMCDALEAEHKWDCG